ncbi:hypothetical protein FQN50_003624 [Emmonsiellopsis sp. PD_5]|nr:hypothetical protein FQN50_003624 [Emmonsiellopsis sp. PD_5]
MAARIPAWKKLGLQLKNAPAASIQEDADITPSASADKQSPSKSTKKRALPSENEEPQGKKQRLENGTAEDKKKSKKNTQKDLKSTELKPSTEQQNAEKEDLPSAKKSKQKRKSVSFADGTKSDDDLQPAEEEIEIDLTPAAIAARRAEKKLKRENRAKNRPASAATQQPSDPSTTTTTHTHPVLRYLSTYHKSRSQWKFQKNRETHLLKHALAVDRIPSTYNAALAAYLAGIKSEGAKKRIAETALEAIKADDVDVESDKYAGDEGARGEYVNTVASFRKGLVGQEEVGLDGWEEDWGGDVTNLSAEWLRKLEKRRRAELVLHFVGGGLLLGEKVGEQPKAAVSKKRKNRTAVIEDTSSSDSSSSESDSDSDDSSSKPTIKKQVNGKKAAAADSSSSDDTSSSGSSSSESSSDSDSGTFD